MALMSFWARLVLTTLLLAGAPLAAAAADGAHDPVPERYIQLLPGPIDPGKMAPGSVSQWQVGVNIIDPPSPPTVTVHLTVDGSMTEIPGGMTLALDWCAKPWNTEGCTTLPRPILDPTPVEELAGEAFDLNEVVGGWLLVTAMVPTDAPPTAQARSTIVRIDAQAQGNADQAPAPTGNPPQPDVDRLQDQELVHTSDGRLPGTGAALLRAGVMAVAAVLIGAGIAQRARRSRSHGAPGVDQ